ncbi:hypothetical protein K8W59_10200 [Nocardioides rotundus]|nr:hypothetical protein K8W59_10200 [Nocardioides rotundus]
MSTDDKPAGPRADRPKRRRFTADYKAAILAEYDEADREQRGVILRREGLYSSHIAEWRKAAEAGASAALGPAAGSARSRRERELDRENAQLRARAEKAEAELARTQAALDLVGKAHALLETLSESVGIETRPKR